MKKKNKIELLAPAGSPEKMDYAFTYGADAVYMGIPDFSLRVRINKFELGDVKKAIEHAHQWGKKVYVTANIYAHNEHLKKLPSYLKKLNTWKPDALIISDPGVMQMAKQYAPDIPIHVSTQANVTNWQAVKFWADQGAERVILGREVTLEEIKEIHKRVPKVELEYFVHGAMCMSYSGRCMLSAWLTGRSANLGDCVQPCRWKYDVRTHSGSILTNTPSGSPLLGGEPIEVEVEEPKKPGMKIPVEEDRHGTYIFNSKDMCFIEYLDELIDAGIVSLKIEGRAKSVAYLACVIKAYREGIDYIVHVGAGSSNMADKLDLPARKKYLRKLKKKYLDKLMHRGYTTGFLFGPDKVEQQTEVSHLDSKEEFVGEVIRIGNVETHCMRLRDHHHTVNKIKKIYIRPHNALKMGDKIRVIQPNKNETESQKQAKNETEFQFSLPQIYAETGEKVDSAHGGTGQLVYILSKRDIRPYSVLMRVK
ncbi:MAG: U32 family peptidase [Candidatus Magasanikbacteria bacterium]